MHEIIINIYISNGQHFIEALYRRTLINYRQRGYILLYKIYIGPIISVFGGSLLKPYLLDNTLYFLYSKMTRLNAPNIKNKSTYTNKSFWIANKTWYTCFISYFFLQATMFSNTRFYCDDLFLKDMLKVCDGMSVWKKAGCIYFARRVYYKAVRIAGSLFFKRTPKSECNQFWVHTCFPWI